MDRGGSVKNTLLAAWIIGRNSYTLIISRDFAEKSGLADSDKVIVEKIDEGIVIKKPASTQNRDENFI